jgi:hypothetical protein
MSAWISCRIDHFTGFVSSCSSSHAAHRGPRDCADRATQGRANNCAASRTAGGSRSGGNRMRTRLSCQFNSLFGHDEPPSIYDHRQTPRNLHTEETLPVLNQRVRPGSIVDSMYGRFHAVQ